ncbi:MAG: DUF4345 domain-containing protein [Actinomycetota bacterium]
MERSTQVTAEELDHGERPPDLSVDSDHKALRVVLGLVGAFIVFFSLNMTLGGFETLGWEGRNDFVDISDQDDFGIQDSHVRFASGVWTGLGLVFIAGARWLHELRVVLVAGLALMFLGGLARLTAADGSVLTSPDILFALALEFVAIPLLAWWILRSVRPVPAD